MSAGKRSYSLKELRLITLTMYIQPFRFARRNDYWVAYRRLWFDWAFVHDRRDCFTEHSDRNHRWRVEEGVNSLAANIILLVINL